MPSASPPIPVLVVSSLVLGMVAALLFATPAAQAGGAVELPALYGP